MSMTLRCLILATLITMGSSAQSFAADGQVTSLLGKITAQRGAQMVGLNPGDSIQSRDTISTGEKSIVRFRMSDDSYFALPTNSSLRIDEYSLPRKSGNTAGRAFFSLLKGGFRTVTGLVGKIDNNSYKVVTPVATLGIRGTEYQVLYIPPQKLLDTAGNIQKGSLTLYVISGVVTVTTVVDGVTTVIEVPEGKSLVIEVTFDANGNVITAGIPVIADGKPAVFMSGGIGVGGSINDFSFDAVFNEEQAIDTPSPEEITAPGLFDPMRPPTIPQPPRIEPGLPGKELPASPS
ncbi:MAG: FecR family protein [Pseudomonadota bacterium]